MSYYESNYYENPGPVYGPEGDFSEPVPGWGPLPNMAGPERLGVGASQPILMPLPNVRITPPSRERSPDTTESGGRPWWVWALAAGAIGAAAGVARKRGIL